jgi:alanyl-tRNA synthetase
MRRLIRRAVRFAFDLGIEQNFLEGIVPVIADMYVDDYPEVAEQRDDIIATLVKEEKVFRQTLRKGINELAKFKENGVTGAEIFTLYDTYGFPLELSTEEAFKQDIKLSDNWREEFDAKMKEQRERSQTAAKGVFKGGLGGQTEIHKQYHTATHLMYAALRKVLGDHVTQHGSNITEERLRFDFNHDEKMTPEQINEVEILVNQWIKEDLPVSYKEYPTSEAFEMGAIGAFGDKYGESVKVYKMGEEPNRVSFEICGGPHVEHTLELIQPGDKVFKITKEESSSAGIRRVKAIIV